MATQHNFMLKVIDARMSDVRKVLKDAGVNVVSIVEVYKEDIPQEDEQTPET
jgi:hypothetical protein